MGCVQRGRVSVHRISGVCGVESYAFNCIKRQKIKVYAVYSKNFVSARVDAILNIIFAEVRLVENNELYRLLEEGLAEIEAGETYSIQEVFEEIEKELYN